MALRGYQYSFLVNLLSITSNKLVYYRECQYANTVKCLHASVNGFITDRLDCSFIVARILYAQILNNKKE